MNDLERQKLDALKELAYGASHEINNPLANIAARAQTLLRDESHPERRRALEAIHQQALRAHEMIADLMLFARPPKLVIGEVNLGDLVRGVAESLNADAAERRIEFQLDLPDEPLTIQADSEQLGVALTALCLNSIEAIGRDGRIQLSVRRRERGERPWATVEVSDTGPGITPEIREHIFDPFFSGREAGRGLGFGLSKCWRIVTEHGGDIEVVSNPGAGATFRINLPLQQ